MTTPRLTAASSWVRNTVAMQPSMSVTAPGARVNDLVFVYSTSLNVYGGDTEGPLLPPGWIQLYQDLSTFGSNTLYGVRIVSPGQETVTFNKAPGQFPSVWLLKAWVVRNAIIEGPGIDDLDSAYVEGTNEITTPALTVPGGDHLVAHFVLTHGVSLGALDGYAPYDDNFSDRLNYIGDAQIGSDILELPATSDVPASTFSFQTGDPEVSGYRVISMSIIGRPSPVYPAMPDPRNLSFDCAESYTAWIVDQDLETRIDTVPWSNLTWERVLDDQSQASLISPDDLGGAYCLARLGGIEPWRFGLLLERNDQEVWKGPIIGVGRPEGEDGRSLPHIEIRAADTFAWYVKRPTTWTGPIVYDETDSGFIFKQVITELARVDADRWTLDCPDIAADEPLKRTLRWEDQETAWSLISELLGASVDAYIMNGVLYVWSPTEGWVSWQRGRNIPLDGPYNQNLDLVYASFTEQSFQSRPGWDIDGMNQANYFSVPTADTGEMGFREIFVAQDGPSQARYGVLWDRDPSPLHRASDDSPAIADGVFQARADTYVALRRVPPAVMTGGILAVGAPVDVENLRPGSIWMADIHDAGFNQLLSAGRLKRVAANVQMTENGVIETISATLYPIGYEGGA